ncbi:MAG: hypothetical protein LBT42_08795 [Tannerella sp.]|jgi:hypothetical protein|nr:hypothetical protein [Tannerella sp.]
MKQLFDSLQSVGGNFHVLEHQVPVDKQLEYFRFSEGVRKDMKNLGSEVDYEQYETKLRNSEIPVYEKEIILSLLASSKQVRAYRILERYAQEPDKELTNWAYMALMESRMLIESELSGQQQAYISTGLGGKGDKLRFFILILSSKVTPFLDYQREIIEKEFVYGLQKNECETERLNIEDKYVELVILAPILVNLKVMLDGIIRECNVYGDFLSEMFTVTNVKMLNKELINRIVDSYGNILAGR